jgi:hypothetical protein
MTLKPTIYQSKRRNIPENLDLPKNRKQHHACLPP